MIRSTNVACSAATIVALSMGAAPSSAQPFQSFTHAGGWSVFFNEATQGCFMEKAQGPYVVQLGTEAAMLGSGEDERFGFVAVYASESVAPDIEQGQIMDVMLEIDGDMFAGQAQGVARDGYRGGYIVSNDPVFAEDLALKQTMVINPGNPNPVSIDLTGTKVAMDAVRTCQVAMTGEPAPEPPEDPASPFVPQGNVAGWNVFFNTTTGGCFMERAQGQYVVQLGTEAAMLGEGEDERFGFLAVYTSDESVNIAQGEQRAVEFDLDGDRFGGTATGVVRPGYRGGYVVSNDGSFANDLAQKQTMIINPDGANPATIDLTGTMRAMEATRACQVEMGAN